MLRFLGTFSVNFEIPDYWGIGKHVVSEARIYWCRGDLGLLKELESFRFRISDFRLEI